jgi:hypothetical protein
MGDISGDLDAKKKRIDSELKKLEMELEKIGAPARKAAPKIKPLAPAKEVPSIKEKPSDPLSTTVPQKEHTVFESMNLGKLMKSAHQTKRLLAGSAFIILIILLAAMLSFVFARPLTKEEFVSRVQGCKSGTYLGQVDSSLVKYSTRNCQVVKEITHVGDREPEEVKILFGGKSMTCQYRKGEFNLAHIDYFTKDIDSCWGELKDIIVELRGYKLAMSRGV